MSSLQAVTDQSFEEDVLKQEGIVIVDFWAPWCSPCKMTLTNLEKVSEEKENIKFFKINVDENKETHPKFGVRNIPTILAFKKGELVNKLNGAQTESDLRKFVDDL